MKDFGESGLTPRKTESSRETNGLRNNQIYFPCLKEKSANLSHPRTSCQNLIFFVL